MGLCLEVDGEPLILANDNEKNRRVTKHTSGRASTSGCLLRPGFTHRPTVCCRFTWNHEQSRLRLRGPFSALAPGRHALLEALDQIEAHQADDGEQNHGDE